MSHCPSDFVNRAWTSTCCGMPAWGEVDTTYADAGKGIGICSGCKDHAEFECEQPVHGVFNAVQQHIIDRRVAESEQDE